MATKKKTAKKVVQKETQTPKNRYFKVDFNGYGGELVIGKVPAKFVDYWTNKKNYEYLEEYIFQYIENPEDFEESNDPDPKCLKVCKKSPDHGYGDQVYWHDIDNIVHENGPSYHDNNYEVTEIELAKGVKYHQGGIFIDPKRVEIDYAGEQVPDIAELSENMFTEIKEVLNGSLDDKEPSTSRDYILVKKTKKNEKDLIPVVMSFSNEKGYFGYVVVETNGEDFNHELLAASIINTSVGDLVEYIKYDGVDVNFETNEYSTRGNGSVATVGYIFNTEKKVD
jgi:hypothetical protein